MVGVSQMGEEGGLSMDLDVLSLIIGFAILFILWVPIILYHTMGRFREIYHDLFGWHVPMKKRWMNENEERSICKFCGKQIKMDDCGNWIDAE